MTVYELIQELTKYKARTEVIFHVKAAIDADGAAEFDRENESDIQDVTIAATIDEEVYFDEIEDNERPGRGSPNIVIRLGN